MQICSFERGQPHFALPRKTDSTLADELEHDGRAYKHFLAIYSDNLNNFIRIHKDCLGELQPCLRLKLCKEEQIQAEQNKQKLSRRDLNKLSKESLLRNATIKKSCEEFFKQYKAQEDADLETKQGQQLKTIDLDWFSTHHRQSLTRSSKKNVNLDFSTLSKRPVSSKGRTQLSSSYISRTMHTIHHQSPSVIAKMRTISTHISQNPESRKAKESGHGQDTEKVKKAIFKGQWRWQQKRDNDCDQFIFSGNQIMIKEGRSKYQQDRSYQTQKNGLGRFCGKGLISLRKTQRQSIMQIQQMQLQNRIFMTSTVLSVNLTQSQGYRPKTRCWQNNFC